MPQTRTSASQLTGAGAAGTAGTFLTGSSATLGAGRRAACHSCLACLPAVVLLGLLPHTTHATHHCLRWYLHPLSSRWEAEAGAVLQELQQCADLPAWREAVARLYDDGSLRQLATRLGGLPELPPNAQPQLEVAGGGRAYIQCSARDGHFYIQQQLPVDDSLRVAPQVRSVHSENELGGDLPAQPAKPPCIHLL